jgi:hypothetical protein
MGAEAALGAGYSVLLLALALGLDLAARHSHQRSLRYRTNGFDFRHDLDAWVCPEGEHLRRIETDHSLRVARYRARAHVCNACSIKDACTDSDRGREIVQPMDPWPHSEAGRFHRGIALVLVALAVVVAIVALARNHAPVEVTVLVPVLGLGLIALGRMAGSFRRMPEVFPDATSPLVPGR